MTDEQYNALAPFEEMFARALENKAGMRDYPGRAAMQTFVAIIKTARPRYRTNLNCRTCVNNTIKDAARMYFGEKEVREAKKPKKTSRKKDAVATPEN